MAKKKRNELMENLARKDYMLSAFLAMSDKDRAIAGERIMQEAEAKSKFKKGELVRLCLSPGISLVGGISELPHDHNDPNQHLDSRVLGWDSYGGLMVATGYGDNPHSGEMTMFEKNVHKRKGDDWAQRSTFKPNMRVTFEWDLGDRFTDGFHAPGHVHRAILVAPHIKDSDWFVYYEKANGGWITRVLNEKIMRPA